MIYEMFNYLYVLSADITSSTGYGLGPGGYLLFMIVGVIFELVIFGVYYTFRSLGLYKMAKNSGLVKPWMAVIPFFGIYACHKLSPNSKYIKKNNIFFILSIIFGGMILLVNCLLDVFYGIPAIFKLVDLSKTVSAAEGAVLPISKANLGLDSNFAAVMSAYLSIVNTAYAVFMLLVYSRLFTSYKAQNVMRFVLFSALVYFATDTFILAGIFVFALRNICSNRFQRTRHFLTRHLSNKSQLLRYLQHLQLAV